MSIGRGRATPRPTGGSRIFTYILLGIVALVLIYYFVVPVLIPKISPTTGVAVSLNPSANIPGTSSSVSGQKFPKNSNLTAVFDGTSLRLANGTTGAASCNTGSKGNFSGCTFLVPHSVSGPHKINVTAGGKSAQATFTVPQYTPPTSSVLVTVTSVSLGLVTQLVTRRVVDLNKERRMKAEVNAFNKEKKDATANGDKAKLEKLKKRELQVRQEQTKVSTARFKVTAITFIPLLAVYYLMANFLGGFSVVVAYSPVPIPYLVDWLPNQAYGFLTLFWWYLLSSFTFSTMLSRALHTTT